MAEPDGTEVYAAAAAAVSRLRSAGYETYLAGGCVRDRLLGRTPKDYDVATAARPEEVEALFRRTIPVGKAFGVVRVSCKGLWFEVATFRRDGVYLDGRRPETVTFSGAAEDAARRDFTINGMFLDPADGRIVDFVGGRADLEARVVRAIGDPEARFDEDALRVLRAVRFAAPEGFTLDPATRAAAERRAGRLRGVAPERVREELLKMAQGSAAARARALDLLFSTGLSSGLLEDAPAAHDGPRAVSVASRCPTPGLPLFLAALFGGAVPAATPGPAATRRVLGWAKALRLSGDEAESLRALLSERVRMRGLLSATAARRRLWATRVDYDLHRELLLAEAPVDGVADAEAIVAALDALRARLGPDRPPPLLDGAAAQRLGARPGPALGRLLRRLRVLQLSERLATPADVEGLVRARIGAPP